MTEDIRTYTFDFQREADALAQKALSITHRNILLTEVDVTASAGKFEDIRFGYAVYSRREGDISSGHRGAVTICYKRDPDKSSMLLNLADTKAVVLRKDESFCMALGAENKSPLTLFALYHETAHALITKGPAVDKDHAYKECAADAFAALSLFQRFGNDAADILSQISWLRATKAILYGSTEHLTTTVLDKIIADSATQDFTQLNPKKIERLARGYATDWTPSEGMLSEARKVFEEGKRVSMLTRTALSSPDNFAFYIGAKHVQPYLKREGVFTNGKRVKRPRWARDRYTSMIDKRASDTTLSDIFGAASDRGPPQPVAPMLKVPRPSGNRPFVYNTKLP